MLKLKQKSLNTHTNQYVSSTMVITQQILVELIHFSIKSALINDHDNLLGQILTSHTVIHGVNINQTIFGWTITDTASILQSILMKTIKCKLKTSITYKFSLVQTLAYK